MRKRKEHLEYPEKTMYQMVRAVADRYPKETAYDFYNKKTSYRSFLAKIDQAAAAFSANGIGKGDAVTICMPNVPQALVCFYALSRIGAIANMVHPLSAENEIIYYLNISESKMMLTLDMFCEKVEKAIKGADHEVTLLVARMQEVLPPHLKVAYTLAKGREYLKYPTVENSILWSRFLKSADPKEQSPIIRFEKNRTAVILYSGGTSGKPKGICLSDYNFNALALQCREMVPHEFAPGMSMLSCMPIFHGFGLGVNIHTALAHGVTCILMPNFSIKIYADMLIKKKPNFVAGVPTIFEALMHMPQMEGKKLDFLLGMFCGGDTLSIELKKSVDEFLREHGASIQIQEGYGLTECVTASCLTPPDDYRPGSIGLPYPDTLYDIVKPGTDEELPRGEEGEIIISGPSVMLGYLKNKEETDKTLRRLADGRIWLYSGDLGRMDEDGFVYFSQRMKRMIITNGYNVYPGILENVIDGMQEVAYSCVVGLKDQRRGQRVKAFVVLNDELKQKQAQGVLDEEGLKTRIIENMKQHIAVYALPREIEFRDELPRTLVGKVAYRILEEESSNE